MDEMVRRLRAEIASVLGTAADLVESIPEQQYKATSPDGMVTVTVSGGSRLLGITVDPRARFNIDNVTLGEIVRDAVNAADAEAAAALRRSLATMR
jgi:DNA-binding protein YbaB